VTAGLKSAAAEGLETNKGSVSGRLAGSQPRWGCGVSLIRYPGLRCATLGFVIQPRCGWSGARYFGLEVRRNREGVKKFTSPQTSAEKPQQSQGKPGITYQDYPPFGIFSHLHNG
jgi:hypothetical protein